MTISCHQQELSIGIIDINMERLLFKYSLNTRPSGKMDVCGKMDDTSCEMCERPVKTGDPVSV